MDGKKKKSSIGEELVDTVHTKGVEEIPQLPGCYSTEQSVLIMGHRIPREGLLVVYYDDYTVASRYSFLSRYIDIDCFYENGDWLSFTTRLPVEKEGRSEAFEKAIRRFDETIPIYHHLYWNYPMIMLLFPYQKYVSQQPTVNKKAIEELPRIYQDNHFWKVSCKSRVRWDGKYEMELSINGTGITWILYLILLTCMVIAFFSFSILGYIGWFAGALCYYFAFYRSAHRLAVRAARSLNCVLQKKKICDSSDH